MPSTYTNNLGIQKPANGEQSGTWGDTVNTNSDILDVGINGVLSLSLSGTSSTLTTSDGTVSNGQYKGLILGGTPSGTHTITISPNDAQKIYFVYNTTSQTVIFTQGSGGNVTLLAGDSTIIGANGAGSTAAVVSIADNLAMSSVNITGGSITGITDLAIADGGTGASTAANARTNLGLGTIATQASSAVTITGGSITGITDLAVADGGTGASDAATARTNLGLAIGTNVLAYDANLQSFVTTFTLPTTDSTNGFFLKTDGAGTLSFAAAGSGTVTSIAVSGGTTGLTTSGGPITSSGTITIAGTLAVANGGTGATDAATARTNLGLTTSGSAPNYLCRAWVNFNGQGTVAIRASGNVSSISDNGVGDYTVNFTTAMQDANFAVTGAVDEALIYWGVFAQTTSYVRVRATDSGGSPYDSLYFNIAIFR